MGSYNIPPGKEPPFAGPNTDPDVEYPPNSETDDAARLAELLRMATEGSEYVFGNKKDAPKPLSRETKKPL